MASKDAKLGQEIKKHLVELGVETPINSGFYYKNDNKFSEISSHFSMIMSLIGLDLKDDSLKDTPNRVAKMYLEEIFYGLNYENFPKCTNIENKMGYDEMLVENKITVSSTCEHHFVTIDGFAKVGYIPKNKVVGLSKLNRIVDFFSKRPQVQERLTAQIYFALCYILETEDVAVEISAVHHCVKSRGIKDTNSYTITRKLGGVFRTEPETRNEFLKSE